MTFHPGCVWCTVIWNVTCSSWQIILNEKKRNEEKTYENISPLAILSHQSPLGYMLQRQQDLGNVLLNNSVEILLNLAWNIGNLSRSQKPNHQMVSERFSSRVIAHWQTDVGIIYCCYRIDNAEEVDLTFLQKWWQLVHLLSDRMLTHIATGQKWPTDPRQCGLSWTVQAAVSLE